MALIDKIIAHYPLNETGGTTVRDRYGSLDMTADATITTVADGVINSTCFDWDGSNGRASVSDDTFIPGASFAVGFWAKFASVAGHQTLVGIGTSGMAGTEPFRIKKDNTDSRFYASTYSTEDGARREVHTGGSLAATTGQWYCIWAGWNVNDEKLYLQIDNGTVFEAALTSAFTPIRTDYNTLWIGSMNGTDDGKALLENVVICEDWPTDAERTSYYNSGNGLAFPYVPTVSIPSPRLPAKQLPRPRPRRVIEGIDHSGSGLNGAQIDAYKDALGQYPESILFVNFFPKPEDILGNKPFPQETIDACHDRNIVPVMSLEPTYFAHGTGEETRVTLEALLSGVWDPFLADYAVKFSALQKRMIIRWGHEMNGRWYHWWERYQSGYDSDSPGRWVQAHNYMWELFHYYGASNVEHMFCMNNDSIPSDLWNQTISNYFPDPSRIDIISLDGYNWEGLPIGQPPFQTLDEIVDNDGNFATLKAAFPGKRFWIGETGTHLDKLNYYQDCIERANRRGFEAVLWFHVDKFINGLQRDRRLPDGVYTDSGSDIITVETRASTPRTERWDVEGRFLRKERKRFFPKGFYVVNYGGETGLDDTELSARLTTIADMGANCVTLPLTASQSSVVDHLEDIDMYVFVEPSDPGGDELVLNAHGKRDAVCGYTLYDDINGKATPAEALTKYRLWKRLAPHKLHGGSGSIGLANNLEDYKEEIDWTGVQGYPISAENLEVYADYTAPGRIITDANYPWIANTQSFSSGGGQRWPTAQETKNMLWQGLIDGATGIQAYTHYNSQSGSNEDLTTQSALVAEWTSLFSELDDIAPFLLYGTYTRIGVTGVIGKAAYWTLNNKVLVVLSHFYSAGQGNNGAGFSLTLPSSATGAISYPLGTTRYSGGASMGGAGGNVLSVTLDEEEVMVAIVDTER